MRLYAIFDRLQEEIRVFEAARRREKAETLSKARDAGELEDRVEALARKESEVRPAEQTTDSTMGTLSSGSRSQSSESKRHDREVVALIGRVRRALKAIGGGSSSSKRD